MNKPLPMVKGESLPTLPSTKYQGTSSMKHTTSHFMPDTKSQGFKLSLSHHQSQIMNDLADYSDEGFRTPNLQATKSQKRLSMLQKEYSTPLQTTYGWDGLRSPANRFQTTKHKLVANFQPGSPPSQLNMFTSTKILHKSPKSKKGVGTVQGSLSSCNRCWNKRTTSRSLSSLLVPYIWLLTYKLPMPRRRTPWLEWWL